MLKKIMMLVFLVLFFIETRYHLIPGLTEIWSLKEEVQIEKFKELILVPLIALAMINIIAYAICNSVKSLKNDERMFLKKELIVCFLIMLVVGTASGMVVNYFTGLNFLPMLLSITLMMGFGTYLSIEICFQNIFWSKPPED